MLKSWNDLVRVVTGMVMEMRSVSFIFHSVFSLSFYHISLVSIFFFLVDRGEESGLILFLLFHSLFSHFSLHSVHFFLLHLVQIGEGVFF